MHFHEQINVPRSNASTLPRGSYNNKPIFIEDGLHEDESSNGSESTSMYSNPVNYSTVKKNNSNFLNRDVRFTPKYFEFPLTEKRYKVNFASFFSFFRTTTQLSPPRASSPPSPSASQSSKSSSNPFLNPPKSLLTSSPPSRPTKALQKNGMSRTKSPTPSKTAPLSKSIENNLLSDLLGVTTNFKSTQSSA